MSWIKTIDYKNSDATLKKIYNRVKGPGDKVDNILQVHSLRPHTLTGHMGLYKNVLHNRNNTIPKWFLESLGVYVSMLNKCDYCVEHHFEGLRKLIQDDTKANRIKAAFEDNTPEEAFDDKELAAIRYAEKLTLKPSSVQEKDIDVLKISKFDDGEILEINQVVSYFSYANRTVLGLGVNTKGDILGLSPNDDENSDNWSHI
jgi:uncharacterized peroxidase-related enzyme